MSDVFSKAKRSEIMSAVHGRGNQSTEWRLRTRLVSSGISGWRVNARDVPGKPDFVFDSVRLAIFVDGCFWHGCRRCRNIPAANRMFWTRKITMNKNRDRKVARILRRLGWRVIRLWEHELRRAPETCLSKIKAVLKAKAGEYRSASFPGSHSTHVADPTLVKRRASRTKFTDPGRLLSRT